jgi:non-ribosomal peptide synthetase component E (peptide arylation enzyme)
MSKGNVDQTPAPSQTGVVSAYDESFSVSEDGRPVPWGRGEFKVSGRYVICPFYGQRTWQEPAKSSGKGK